MANFSKGNWQINKHLDITCNGRYVALVCYTNPITPLDNQSTARANARLIAEAPEMYECLSWFIQQYSHSKIADTMLIETMKLKARKILERIDGKDE